FPASPTNSLLLQKPAGQVPHGGGKKIAVGDPFYQTMLRWIEAGMPRTPETEPTLLRITVEPAERLMKFHETQPLKVTAHFGGGASRDVPELAMFQSSESVLAAVSSAGVIKAGPIPGEAAITARFMEKFAVCNVVIPQPKSIPADVYAKLPKRNFVD